VVIADEAHHAQSLAARRTRRFLRLARHPRLRAIWLLTGTPMRNGRPSQLFPLLAAIDHPLGRDQRSFEERYCQGFWQDRGGHRVWQARGATHLDELRRLVRPLVLHRGKQQCLDLPPKQRQLREVRLDSAEAFSFQKRLEARVEDYRRRAALGQVRRDAEVLAVLTGLRMIGSTHKLPAAVALVRELLAAGEPVVLFTAFVASARELHSRLDPHGPAALLTGAVPVRRRQALVDRFQRGHDQLLVATYGTAGLGFTLHRARHVVLLERPWTPGDAEQAEDRCHRIGMGAALTSHWMRLGLADHLVDELISSKAERIATVFDSPRTRQAHAAMAERARRMLENW
jgi:SNF2 family DNA or RNA helicase